MQNTANKKNPKRLQGVITQAQSANTTKQQQQNEEDLNPKICVSNMISQTNFYNSFFCIHMIQSFIVSELAEQKIFDISEYFKNGMRHYIY